MKYSTSDLDPESCAAIFGGTVTAVGDKKNWERPKKLTPKLVSTRFTTRSGLKVTFKKMRMRSKFNWKVSKKDYGLIEHTLTALSPIGIGEE